MVFATDQDYDIGRKKVINHRYYRLNWTNHILRMIFFAEDQGFYAIGLNLNFSILLVKSRKNFFKTAGGN